MIKVIIYKLDDPTSKYTWWRKEIDLDCKEDMDRINGFCGNHIYARIVSFNNKDPLYPPIHRFIKENYNTNIFDLVELLFQWGNAPIFKSTKKGGDE